MSKNGKTGREPADSRHHLKSQWKGAMQALKKWKRYSNGATYSNYLTEGGREDNRKAKNGSSVLQEMINEHVSIWPNKRKSSYKILEKSNMSNTKQ